MTSVGIGNAALVTGTMQVQNLTKPGGGVWLPGPVGSPGHYWVPDGVLGICEVISQTPATPPFTTTKCNGTPHAGKQAVYDSVNKKLYVADGSTTSVAVVRFDYNSALENLSNPVAIQVANQTSVGGGAGGGRTASIALSPDNSKLYVGYTKSGDIMVVNNPATATNTTTPPAGAVQKVSSTTDGRGTQGFAMVRHTVAGVVHDDLYIAEVGGAGLSSIGDIDGTGGRPVCGTSVLCTTTTVHDTSGAIVSFFPGGLAYDGTLLYVGNAQRNLPASVLQYSPDTGQKATFSTDITPAYTSTSDGATRTQYAGITGIGLGLNNDVLVGDDPTVGALVVTNAQGHLWNISGTALRPSVASLTPASGVVAGGDVITIAGTNLVNAVAGASTVSFGTKAATNVTCVADGTSCTATSPFVTGTGAVDVRVTNGDGQTSPAVPADVFTYTAGAAAAAGTPVITSIAPDNGVAAGGTSVVITGTDLTAAGAQPTISFGATGAASLNCASTTSCTAVSPPGADGSVVDIQVSTLNGSSALGPQDKFTYHKPVGTLATYGITAPKGGLTWVPDTMNGGPGHYWVSDHSNGLCRLDAAPGVPAGSKLHAVNWDACDPGFTIGSPGQAVYDPAANLDGTHFIYIPDNAVKSPGVWRLTLDPVTATVSNPISMAPGLMDNLKTNSLALDAANNALYVGDLVDGNIRRINKINGDPRLQTVDVVATTQAQNTVGTTVGRGINGTIALLGSKLFLPENNAATYFDTTALCAAVGTTTPCRTTPLNFLPTPAPVFVSGIGTDSAHGLVYISSSPGGANATIWRFNAATITAATPGGTAGFVYVTAGNVPAAGTPEATVRCSLSCTRTTDVGFTGVTSIGFFFASGLYVDPNTNSLFITEDATAGARSGRGHGWEVPYIP